MKILGLLLGIAMIVVMAFLTNAFIEFFLRFSKIKKSRSHGAWWVILLVNLRRFCFKSMF